MIILIMSLLTIHGHLYYKVDPGCGISSVLLTIS